MTADMTFCAGKGCPKARSCLRCICEPVEKCWQSYFVIEPFEELPSGEKRCEYYIYALGDEEKVR